HYVIRRVSSHQEKHQMLIKSVGKCFVLGFCLA
ncbi:hypothetical protein CP082626L3_0476B, partial [Chlamydia psittaci 08-2626_L3]